MELSKIEILKSLIGKKVEIQEESDGNYTVTFYGHDDFSIPKIILQVGTDILKVIEDDENPRNPSEVTYYSLDRISKILIFRK